MNLRVMRREDIAAGLRLCRASGWNQIQADWELFLEASPDGCRVAVDETGAVVGTVATIRYRDRFAWVGMVLVDPAHRRKGIGTRLLSESLAILGDVPTVRLDATPAGRPVYTASGFVEEYALQRMRREKGGTAPFPEADRKGAVPLFRRMTDEDFDTVASWDQDVFGADRRRLLESFRRNAPEYAWVVPAESGIHGYVFGRHGYESEHIGPLVARDDQAAQVLVETCLLACADRPFIIDVPMRSSWLDWLTSNAFALQRPFTRMARGDRRFLEDVSQMFATAGPEFG